MNLKHWAREEYLARGKNADCVGRHPPPVNETLSSTTHLKKNPRQLTPKRIIQKKTVFSNESQVEKTVKP
jgi:hypothetical protein